MNFHLFEEISYLLVAPFVVGGSWAVLVLLKQIKRRRKSRSIERGIANYIHQLEISKGHNYGLVQKAMD